MGGYVAQQGAGPAMMIDPIAGSNFRFQPLSQVNVQSSNPEAIAQGAGQGISNLAGGLFKGYQDRRQAHPAAQQPSPYAQNQAPLIAQTPTQVDPFTQFAAAKMDYPSNYSPELQQAMYNAGVPSIPGLNFIGNPFLQ